MTHRGLARRPTADTAPGPSLRSVCRWAPGGAVGLAIVSAIVSAHASPLAPAPEPERFAAWGGLAYYTASQRASAFQVASHNLGAAYAFDRRWAVSLDWGVAGLRSTSDAAPAEVAFVLGNPTAFGWYGLDLGGTRVRFGAGMAFPAATVGTGGSGRLERAAYTHANAMDGLSRLWLWAPNRTSALLRAEGVSEVASWLAARVAITPGLFVPAWSSWANESLDFITPTQVGLTADYAGFELGGRFQAVWVPTNSLDQMQMSVEPGLGYATKDLRAGCYGTINLDEPLAGARGPGIWGLHLALEVKL